MSVSNKISIKKSKLIMETVASHYQCRIKFIETREFSACVDVEKRKINFSLAHVREQGLESNLSVLFHELGHVYNFDNGYYPKYHDPHLKNNKRNRLAIKRTMWRAEVFTDKVGKRLMKEYFPELKYEFYYTKNPPKWKLKWLKEYLKDEI